MTAEREKARVETCYHEAAHAVFDYHAGLTIRRVYVTERLNAECVSAVPVEPYPWQAMELAAGLFAGEIAVYRRWGEQMPPVPFGEFAAEEDVYHELAEYDGVECDDLQALRMLEIVASWSDNPWGDLEACYAAARESAALNVELWWPEIAAVAERLRQTGHLDGEDCVRLIESIN